MRREPLPVPALRPALVAATPEGRSPPSLGLEARRASDRRARVRSRKDTHGCAAQAVTQQRELKVAGRNAGERGAPPSGGGSAAKFARGMLTPAGRMRGRSGGCRPNLDRDLGGAELSERPQPRDPAWRGGGEEAGMGRTWASEALSSHSVSSASR